MIVFYIIYHLDFIFTTENYMPELVGYNFEFKTENKANDISHI